MAKKIVIKLTKAGGRTGPFSISDNYGNILSTNVSKSSLVKGISFIVEDDVSVITITSLGGCGGKCTKIINIPIEQLYYINVASISFEKKDTSSIWKHLTNPKIYNKFYDNIEPYIIEYPFAYQYQDEILQNIKDYTKAYNYLDIPDGVWNYNNRIEVDNQWFNKAILYNGQQSTGLLELVPKPIHNLKEYLKYPIYNTDSKTITYTKSDNFYQYNTFWSLIKNKNIPLFVTECCSLSIDKTINQTNMDYSKRSFKKEPLRAKELKVRHILDSSCTTHLVSQFIIAFNQISYK
jgi:hypothetical protein